MPRVFLRGMAVTDQASVSDVFSRTRKRDMAGRTYCIGCHSRLKKYSRKSSFGYYNTNCGSFITRYLAKEDQIWPVDADRLRISPLGFDLLCSHFRIHPAFIMSLVNFREIWPCGFPSHTSVYERKLDFWLFLPIRVGVECHDRNGSHSSSSGKVKQMNPFTFLHLTRSRVDVKLSKIGLYFVFDQKSANTRALVFDFQDGQSQDSKKP